MSISNPRKSKGNILSSLPSIELHRTQKRFPAYSTNTEEEEEEEESTTCITKVKEVA